MGGEWVSREESLWSVYIGRREQLVAKASAQAVNFHSLPSASSAPPRPDHFLPFRYEVCTPPLRRSQKALWYWTVLDLGFCLVIWALKCVFSGAMSLNISEHLLYVLRSNHQGQNYREMNGVENVKGTSNLSKNNPYDTKYHNLK